MGKIYLYCDESGSKGYADQPETFPGEVGVIAGLLVPDTHMESALARFDAIAREVTSIPGKLHVADLRPEQQHALRGALYKAIGDEKLPCFWYAVHVEGFHAYYLEQKRLLATWREQSRSQANEGSRFKRGSLREEAPSLHVELFCGLYARAVAYLIERQQRNVDLLVRTDQVDSPIASRFEKVAVELLDDDPSIKSSTAYDSIEKKIVHGSITTTVEWPDDMKMPHVVNSLSIEPMRCVDGLVLAADVLANSLNYLFKKRDATALYNPLNSLESVAAHPVANHFDVFRDWGCGDLIGDRLYAHPRARPPKD